MKDANNITIGLIWGTLLSIPLWMSLIGWIQLIVILFLKLNVEWL
ncbi:hypothetical protein [Paenibacillus alkalitolerans]|nr:hypothetical protein [Paenibacillus alkalitolerans]